MRQRWQSCPGPVSVQPSRDKGGRSWHALETCSIMSFYSHFKEPKAIWGNTDAYTKELEQKGFTTCFQGHVIQPDQALDSWHPCLDFSTDLWSVLGFSSGSVVKNLPSSAGNADLISGSGRSPGEGNGNPLQYSCLENSRDRGVYWAIAHGMAEESDTSEHACIWSVSTC